MLKKVRGVRTHLAGTKAKQEEIQRLLGILRKGFLHPVFSYRLGVPGIDSCAQSITDVFVALKKVPLV